ncbi:GntR family transcriptional regulator [bacterium]|nr:GntR family transcriptional regulator [bacterium]
MSDEPIIDDVDEPRTRADWVDQKLREAILSGELVPGQRLQTAALGKMWSVSQTPLREAFQRLAVEGLLDLVPQRGARVAGVSLADAYEVHELRSLLEPVALRMSMGNGDDEWIADLDRAHAYLTTELRREEPDRGAVEAAHREYHQTLLERCPSGWMLRILDLLNSHIIRYWTLSAAPRRDVEAVIAEHDRIHEYVRTGKVEVATAELGAHLQNALHSVLERMTESALQSDADEA